MNKKPEIHITVHVFGYDPERTRELKKRIRRDVRRVTKENLNEIEGVEVVLTKHYRRKE